MASGDRNLRLEVILAALDKATGPMKAVLGGSSKLAQQLRATKDELKQLNAAQKNIDGFRDTTRAIAVASNELKGNQARLKALKAEMASTVAPSKALVREFERVRSEAHGVATRHAQLIQKQQRLRESLRGAGIDTKKLGDDQRTLKTRMDAVSATLAAQEAKYKAVGVQMRKLAAARAQYDKTIETRNKMAGAGAGMVAGGGAALFGGARMLQEGIEFSKTMSKVQALTRLDKNSADLATLRQQARDLGATTMFSATDAARGQAFLAMAGFTPESIKAAMPGLLDMALAGDVDLGAASNIAANILGGFRLDPAQMGYVSDVLTKAFTTSNTSLETLGDTMRYVGPVAASAGMKLEEAAAMAGLLGNVGIQGQKAGTTMRAMLLRLAAPVGPAAAAMKELSLNAMDAQGNVRSIPLLLSEVAKATEKMGSGERLGYLKRIFGEEPAAGMASLIDQAGSGAITKYLEIIGENAGAAAKTAKTMADNVTGDLDELSSAWSDVQIELFDSNEGALRGLLQTLTNVVGGVATWMKENPKLTSTLATIAVVIATIVTGMGALTLAIAAMLGPFAMLRYGIAIFPVLAAGIKAVSAALLMNPIGLAIAGIAIAALLIYKYWEPISTFFVNLWNGIGNFFSTLPERFAAFGMQIIQGLIRGILGTPDALKNAVASVGANVVGWFKEKLGISSPSRVFAELGGFTMQGLTQGLQANAGGPRAAITRTAAQLAAAAGMGLAGINGAGAVPIDTRPPLATGAGAAQGGIVVTNYITIQALPGMDEKRLAQFVATEIDRITRASEARGRSRLADSE